MEQFIRKHFSTISSSKLLVDTLIDISQLYSFNKGEVILKESSYVQQIPLVVSGIVKVYKEEENGNEVLIYYIKPGESCIMSIVAAEKDVPVNIKAVIEETAQIILIPKNKLSFLRNNFDKWNLFVYSLFNEKFDEVIEMIKILTFSNKEKRLLDYLKRISQLTKSKIVFKSHQEIANELGTSREVISRLLKKTEKDKKIILSQRKIELI
jgi:CRP/FNR family transcriptional regulator